MWCQKMSATHMENSVTFSFLPTFHLPCFNTLFSDSDMQLSPEESSTGSQEPHSVPGEGMAGSEKVESQWEAAKDAEERQKAKIDAQKTEILRLRTWKERYTKKYAGAKEKTAKLEHQIRKASKAHQETLEKRDQQIQAMADRLTRTEELLASRSAELSGAQSFLSTTDSLSEVEVLGIVRDLNENVFQVAATLTEEWEKLGLPRTGRFTVIQHDVEALAPICGPALIQSALDRDPTAVTFLVQSCLCYLATQITLGWRHDQKLVMLESVHQRLSASSKYTSQRPVKSKRDLRIPEGQAISARWRSLTHSHLPQSPPHSTSIIWWVADVLRITGSFSSSQRSFDFVKTVALRGIETIDRLAVRLESAFMVEVTSSDMSLLFETPYTVFNKARMIDEFGSDGVSTPGRRDKVAGTAEVGVAKSVCGRRGEGRRMEVLLKPKVVLEKDVTGS